MFYLFLRSHHSDPPKIPAPPKLNTLKNRNKPDPLSPDRSLACTKESDNRPSPDACTVGQGVHVGLGMAVGKFVGLAVGSAVGSAVGTSVGTSAGIAVDVVRVTRVAVANGIVVGVDGI